MQFRRALGVQGPTPSTIKRCLTAVLSVTCTLNSSIRFTFSLSQNGWGQQQWKGFKWKHLLSPKINLQFVLWNLILPSEYLFHLGGWVNSPFRIPFPLGGSMTSQLSFALLCRCHTCLCLAMASKMLLQWPQTKHSVKNCCQKYTSRTKKVTLFWWGNHWIQNGYYITWK